MKVLFFLTTLIFLMACTPEEESKIIPINTYSGAYSKEIASLVQDNESIQSDLAQNIIFQGATTQQVSSFRDFLVSSRRILLRLLNDPKDASALQALEKLTTDAAKAPIQIRDQAYIMPYIKELNTLIEQVYILQGRKPISYAAQFNFSKDVADLLIFEREEKAGEFLPRSNDHGEYLGVDSFKNKNDGKSLLITPEFTLEDLDYIITFKYVVRFYTADARSNKLIKFHIGQAQENVADIIWSDLEIDLGPDAANFSEPPSITLAKNLELKNTKVRIKVEYASDATNAFFPALNIFSVEIKENRE